MDISKPEDPPKGDEGVDTTEHAETHISPRLDPDFVDYLLKVAAENPSVPDLSIEGMRAHPEMFRLPTAIDTSGYERVADHQVTSEDGTSITARVYHPDPEAHGPGPYPVHLNFHGELRSSSQR